MRRDFENTVDERTAVQGDNKLDNNKEERLLKCPNTLRGAGAVKVTVTPTGKIKEAND